MIDKLLIICAVLGLCGWIVHLLFILQALRSKPRGNLFIEYNRFHEMYIEIVLIIAIIIFNFYVIFQVI